MSLIEIKIEDTNTNPNPNTATPQVINNNVGIFMTIILVIVFFAIPTIDSNIYNKKQFS